MYRPVIVYMDDKPTYPIWDYDYDEEWGGPGYYSIILEKDNDVVEESRQGSWHGPFDTESEALEALDTDPDRKLRQA